MSIDKIIASIPQRSVAERRTMRENAGRKMLNGSGAEQEAALALIRALDEADRSERAALAARMMHATPRERVVAAYRARPPSATDMKVVQALLNRPGSTSAALSAACGWEGHSWHLHFGLMCFNREAWLWPAERVEKRDAKFYTGILADFSEADHTFTMKPEVEAAFAEIGIRKK